MLTINIDYEIIVLSEVIEMKDDKWILCCYNPEKHKLCTYEFNELKSAMVIIKDLVDTYGDVVEYKLFKGEIWL